MMTKYDFIDKVGYDKISDLYEEIRCELSRVDDGGLHYAVVDDLNKILYQGIELSYDKDKVLEIFLKLLNDFIRNMLGKTFILFINSDICKLNLPKGDNVYFFDIGKVHFVFKYNLISFDVIKELDFKIIREELFKKYPLVIDKDKLDSYICLYYIYHIYLKRIYVSSEEKLFIFTILSRINDISQDIIPKNLQINDSIKSFLTTI